MEPPATTSASREKFGALPPVSREPKMPPSIKRRAPPLARPLQRANGSRRPTGEVAGRDRGKVRRRAGRTVGSGPGGSAGRGGAGNIRPSPPAPRASRSATGPPEVESASPAARRWGGDGAGGVQAAGRGQAWDAPAAGALPVPAPPAALPGAHQGGHQWHFVSTWELSGPDDGEEAEKRKLSKSRCQWASEICCLWGKDASAFATKMRGGFWPALKMNWKVWTPVQFINVNYVPLQGRK
ncbi:peroxisomal membrane protein 2 isoform X1 [Callithrix jacchus]